MPPRKKQILDWQATALYYLAHPYDRVGGHVLEIGTARGFSAAVLSLACSRSSITTLNPDPEEAAIAAGYLRPCTNITILEMRSWDYLDAYRGPQFDLIFVDGDHNAVALDLPWFEKIRPHGLMLFHDYDEVLCPPVYQAVRKLAGGQPDVELIDDSGRGIAGLYKRE